MIPLLESEITPEMDAIAVMYDLEDFPRSWLVEEANHGFMFSKCGENGLCIPIGSPIENRYYPDLKIFYNPEAKKDENSPRLSDRIVYAYAWSCANELLKCTNWVYLTEILNTFKYRYNIIVEDRDIEKVLSSIYTMVLNTEHYSFDTLFDAMKKRQMFPFYSKIKWLN